MSTGHSKMRLPDGSVVVYGWAADPEAIARALDVHVYVDGLRTYQLRTGTQDRPDALAVTGAQNAWMGRCPTSAGTREAHCLRVLDQRRRYRHQHAHRLPSVRISRVSQSVAHGLGTAPCWLSCPSRVHSRCSC